MRLPINGGERAITLPDFLTGDEIAQASKLWRACQKNGESFAPRCEREIIRPVIARINESLGQENDPRFLAYAVEYVLGKIADREYVLGKIADREI